MDLPLPTAFAPPYLIAHPAVHTAPLVFASPHSGRDYTPDFLRAARLDPLALRRSEDSFVDELFADAPALGAPLLCAQFPRAWCDANREKWELDPAMFSDPLPAWVNTASARVNAGLGTIARVVASGDAIYRRKLRFADAEHRVRTCWEPYHTALAELLADTWARFGRCLLVDCHSMPSAPSGRDLPDFVLGDAHGTACAPAITRHVETLLTNLGYRVRRNNPYAGGFTTRHYGHPRDHRHALQIEIARPLYMDEQRFERSAGFAGVREALRGVVQSLVENAGVLVGVG